MHRSARPVRAARARAVLASPAAVDGRAPSGSAARVPRRRALARDRLARSLGRDAVIEIDAVTGGVRFLGRLDGALTGPTRGSARDTALGYVRAHQRAFGLDLRRLRLV